MMGNTDPNHQALQEKLQFLNNQLKMMTSKLPQKFHHLLPDELLASLAESLLDNSVFRIVDHLMETQHVTESQLCQQRMKILNKQYLEMQELMSNPLMDDVTKQEQQEALELKHQDQLELHDTVLILELDEKATEQQRVLDMAGVPGFEVTNDALKIQMQIRLLECLSRLSQMQIP